MLEVTMHPQQIDEQVASLRGAPLAIMRALNRTALSVRTEATRAIAADLGIAQREVREKLLITRATPTSGRAAISISGARIPLLAFGARQTPQGVSYRLRGGRSVVPSAFLAAMRSGHHGVFKRLGRARLPITELFGPSLPRVFTRAKILQAMRTKANAELGKNLAHEMQFLLGKTGLQRSEVSEAAG